MLRIKLICVGNLKEKYFKDAFSEYEKRLGAFCRFEVIEVSEYKVKNDPSAGEIDNVKNEEGKKILSKISSNSRVISLCVEGEKVSSEQLSSYIEALSVSGVSEIDFVIGGSFGLSEEVKKISNLKLSMSLMTLPHQLARVILCEQIYRAFQISLGGKYHK